MRILLAVAAMMIVVAYQTWVAHPIEEAELARTDASEASLIIPLSGANECSAPIKIEDRDRTGVYATD